MTAAATVGPGPGRAGAWEWVQAALIAANLAWTMLCLGGVLASTIVITSTLSGATLAVHFLARASGRSSAPPTHPGGWLLLPFLVYATINVAWITPVPWLGWQDWLGWAQMIATFWVVLNGIRSRGPRTLLVVTLVGLGLVAVLMACYQRFVQPDWIMLGRTQSRSFIGRASGPFGIPNSLAAFLILLLPAGLALAFRRGAAATERVLFGWLAVVFAFGLVLTISRGGWIGFALAMVGWPLLSPRWAWWRRFMVAGVVLLAVLAVGATVLKSSSRARARFEAAVRDSGELSRPALWRAAWKIFRAAPAFGGGAGSFNALYERHRPEHDQLEPVWTHNDYLNTLSDYGAVGGILFFGACGFIAWRSYRGRSPPVQGKRHPSHRALDDPLVHQAFFVGLVAFALHLFVDFHLKIPALAMSAAIIGGLLVSQGWNPDDRQVNVSASARFRIRLAHAGLAVLVVFGGGWWIGPRVRAEGIREDARREMDSLVRRPRPPAEKRLVLERSRNAFARAAAVDPANAQAWADHAYALAIIGHEDRARERELGREAEVGARRALAQTVVVPEYWVRLGVALDMQRRWLEAGDAFTEALRIAPRSAPGWFHVAYHYSLNPVTKSYAVATVATCLRLDPSHTQAENLRRHLAAGP